MYLLGEDPIAVDDEYFNAEANHQTPRLTFGLRPKKDEENIE